MNHAPRDADLAESYELCRRLHARHGRSYYLATRLLPGRQRYAVHALYGFARYIDDIVDVPIADAPSVQRLDRITDIWRQAVDHGRTRHPVFAATADTVRRCGIDPQLTYDFLQSMRQDLTITRYADWPALSRYTWGSASVIGLEMAHVIGIHGDRERALRCAALLGEAFQLTNFCRDYDEDRLRGRVYLPESLFADHGIEAGSEDRVELRAVIACAVRRARGLYAEAEPGIALLHPSGRPCIRAAFDLYQGILDEIERAQYDVVGIRHAVPMPRKLAIVARALSRRGGPATTMS